MRLFSEPFASRWTRFWLSDGSALNLAVARILVAGQALWVVLSRDYPAISGLPPVFWDHVIDATRWRFLLFPGAEGIERIVYWVAVVALLAALLGLHARVACFVAALALYHLAPLESAINTATGFARGLTIPVLALVVLALGRPADRLRLPWGRQDSPPPSPWHHAWQLRLIQLFVCQVYLFSALAKLERVGFAWVSASNIQRWVGYMIQDPEMVVYRSVGAWLVEQPALAFGAALGTMVFELGFIVALFWKRSRPWFVLAGLVFHLGILVSMNLMFASALLLPVLLDWDRVWERWGRRRHTTMAPA